MSEINVLQALMIIGCFLIAIPLHEFGHALMAFWLGDRTPRNDGRLSLSWSAHIDSLGLLMCVIMAFLAATGFGWGKPVKPDPWKMRVGPNTGMLLVAWAGPLFSLIIGLLAALLLRFLMPVVDASNIFLLRLLQLLTIFSSVNICLTLFNLLPFYPLDGYQIVYTLLPSRQAVQFAKSAPYGSLIILVLFFFLPFLANLTGLGTFPLFHIPAYVLYGANSLVALTVGGNFPISLGLINSLYFY